MGLFHAPPLPCRRMKKEPAIDLPLLPFNITFQKPGVPGLYGQERRAVSKRAVKKEFLADNPTAIVLKVEDWYEF